MRTLGGSEHIGVDGWISSCFDEQWIIHGFYSCTQEDPGRRDTSKPGNHSFLGPKFRLSV